MLDLTSPFDGLTSVALAIAVILSAIVSLTGSAKRREQVELGEAGVQDLCELTGILDPKELQDVFGPPDMGRIWRTVRLGEVYAARRPLGHLISGQAVDWLCIGAALASFAADHLLVGTALAMAVSAQAVGWVLSARLPK